MSEDNSHATATQVTAHTRTIHERPITFRCQECGDVVTESRRPGPTPRYCNPCWPSVQTARNAARVRQHRERRRQERTT